MHSSVSTADVVVFLNQRHEMWTNAFHQIALQSRHKTVVFHSVRKRLFQIYPAGGFWLGHYKIYVEVYSLKVYDVVMNPLPLNTI